MKGIKKRMRESSRKLHARLGKAAEPYVSKAKERLKVDERIKKANDWASAHPRRFFAYVIGCSVVILSMSLFIGLQPAETESEIEAVPSPHEGISTVIEGMREIHRNKEIMNATIQRARDTGDRLRGELDSLNSLSVKTREDSLDIAHKRKQLQGIIKLFENHDK